MSHQGQSYTRGDEPVPGYRLAELLGRGGFGEVWKATAPGGAEVALKFIKLGGREGRKEFKALQLVKRIRHAHLVPIIAFWLKRADGSVLDDGLVAEHDLSARTTADSEALQATMIAPPDHGRLEASELIIAMGLGDESLSDRLERCRKEGLEGIPQERLLEYMEDAAKAIDYLNHPIEDIRGSGIQHCDIKPHNIMLVGGATQVCDFGLAQMLGADRTTSAAASLAYAAPECLREGLPSNSTDQYSLAVTYYELRTGKLPYGAETHVAVMNAKLEGTLDLSGVSADEQRVLRRATSPDPAKRYASATELVAAIRSAVSPAAEAPRKRPNYLLRALALAAVAGLVVLGFVLFRNADRGHQGPGPGPWSREEFEKNFQGLLDDRNFVLALEWLDDPSADLADGEKGDLRQNVRAAWLAEVQRAWQGESPEAARRVCRDFLHHFPGEAKARLTLAKANSRLEKYEESLKDLDALEATDDLPGHLADESKKLREEVREAWFAEIQRAWREEPPQATREICGRFLTRFPGDCEGKLMRARALARLGDWQESLKDLQELGPVEGLPEHLRLLHFALSLIVEGFRSERDPVVLVGWCEQFEAVRGSSEPSPAWSLDQSELNQVGQVRQLVFDHLLGKAVNHISNGERDEAVKILKLADKPSAPQSTKPRTETWLAIVDPDVKPDQVPWETAGQLMQDVPLPEKRVLAGTLAQMAQWKNLSEQDLRRAIEVVRLACDNPREKEIRRQLKTLWEQRIAILLTAEAPPAETDYRRLEGDWGLVEAAGFRSSLVDAWRAEYLLELGRDQSLAYELADRAAAAEDAPSGEAAYVHYVKSRAQDASPRAVEHLDQVLPDDGPVPQFLSVRGRLQKTVDLAIQAALRRREQARATQSPLDRLLGRLPSEQPDVAQYYRLLKKVYAAGESEVDEQRKQQLQVNLTLAAWHQPQPDVELARSLSSELVKSIDRGLAEEDAIPILSLAVRSRLALFQTAPPAVDDPQLHVAVAACGQLARRFREEFRGGDDEAVAFYTEIVQPVLSTADAALAKADAKTLAGLPGVEELYAAAGDLMQHYKRAEWPFGDGNLGRERLFGQAIALHRARPQDQWDDQKLAEYHLKRGHARVEQSEPKLDEALDDAKQSLNLQPDMHRADGLLGHVYLVRARQRASREDYTNDLSASIAAGERAAAEYPETDEFLPDCLLNLSSAYLERANIENDPNYERQKKDLVQAIGYANRAKDFRQRYPEYVYLALGNACEDLAWLVEHEPEENYKRAMTAFAEAYAKNPMWAQPLCSLGRCYYRYAAATYLDPRLLQPGMQTRNEVIDRCKAELQKALNLDPDLIEAHCFLALASQYLNEYAEADQAFERAKSLAEKQQDPYRVFYISSWAAFPLSNRSLSPEEQCEEALIRTQSLQDVPVPPGAAMEPKKEEAWIRSQVLRARGQHAEALRVCSQSLPTDLSGAERSDVNLLLARSRCRTEAEQSWAAVDSAIQDARRAAELSHLRGQKVIALARAAEVVFWAYYEAYGELTSTSEARAAAEQKETLYLDQGIQQFQEAVRLAPRHPNSPEWAEKGALLIARRISRTGEHAQVGRLAYRAATFFRHSIDWIEHELELTVDPGDRDRLKRKQAELGSYEQKAVQWLQGAIRRVEEEIQRSADPQKLAELKQQLTELEDYRKRLQP